MSVMDSAQQLVSHANDYLQNAIAATSTVGDDLMRAMQNVSRVQELATESMARTTDLLGSGHGGMGGIGAAANAVSQKAEDVIGSIQQALSMVLDLDQAINAHSSRIGEVGHQILQGG